MYNSSSSNGGGSGMGATPLPYQPSRVELFKQQHDIAFNFLKKGIDYDEEKDFEQAREYYREGIQCILQAERIPLTQQERLQVKILLDKLLRHKTMFYDRMKEIDQLLHEEKLRKQQDHNNNTYSSINNNTSNNTNGFFSGIMKLFGSSGNSTTTTTSNTSATSQPVHVSQDTMQLCSASNGRYESMPVHHYTASSQVLKAHPMTQSAFGLSSSSSSSSNQQQTPPLRRKSTEEWMGHHGNLPQHVVSKPTGSFNMSSSSSSFTQRPPPVQTLPLFNSQQQPSISSVRNAISSPTPNTPSKKVSSINDIPEFKGIDKKLLDHILNEVIETKTTSWDDIAGLKDAKQTLMETVILPSLRPDLFNGLRALCRGILLFGPPGTGKTMIARACASQSQATFFSISAGSLVSRYHGDGEKLVRCLFAAARYLQPSVIFIDEIDSILSQRSSEEHEASRRMKTEFMIQMDGVSNMNGKEERVLVMGATNIPDELDEAILRRFTKRVHVPLPDVVARTALIKQLTNQQHMKLSEADLYRIATATEGFSGADLTALCKETYMLPIREISAEQLMSIDAGKIRPVVLSDFMTSLSHIRPSTSRETIKKLQAWNEKFGTFAGQQ